MALLSPTKRVGRGRAETPTTREQFLLFRVGDEVYGLGLRGLRQVLPPDEVVALPTPPYQTCAALAYRGRRLPIIRMTELFGVPKGGAPGAARVLLTQGQGRPVGLLVDEVLEIAGVDPAGIAPVPALATLLDPSFFRGLFGREERVILLVSEDGLAGFEEVGQFYAGAP